VSPIRWQVRADRHGTKRQAERTLVSAKLQLKPVLDNPQNRDESCPPAQVV
jgi:hypothetical protein